MEKRGVGETEGKITWETFVIQARTDKARTVVVGIALECHFRISFHIGGEFILLPFSFNRNNTIRSPASRHEEHVQNIRRFHESLQQGDTVSKSENRLNTLPLSSSPSILTSLRCGLVLRKDIGSYMRRTALPQLPLLRRFSKRRSCMSVLSWTSEPHRIPH